MRLTSLPCAMLVVGVLPGWLGSAAAADAVLPGTDPLLIERPLDEVMVEGLNHFCRRELAASRQQRAARWEQEFSSDQAGAEGILRRRQRFRALIGAADPRAAAAADGRQRFELVSALGQSPVVARSSRVTVHAVRWPVLEGVTAEGLLLVPAAPRAGVVALPDADWTPEAFCGLSGELPESVQFARSLAEAGCLVAVPTLISRSDEFSGSPHVAYTNQPHREFIYRQAFEVGRHIIGYEVQKILAAVDLLEEHAGRKPAEAGREPMPIGVAGVGEGGLLAFYSAAIDPRIQSCWVSGYFQQREEVWREPIYRNVWGLLTEFGDAELAGMIAPRRLVIEACRAVEVAGPPTARQGRRNVAAPGRITTDRLISVRAEFDRAAAIYGQAGRRAEIVLAVSGENGGGPAGTGAALRAFVSGLRLDGELDRKPEPWQPESMQDDEPRTALRDAAAREKRQFDELQNHVQGLLRRSHQVRDAKWRLNPASVDQWERSRPRLRDWVHDELIGRLTAKRLPPHPRSRRVLETGEYTGYEIVLDVCEDIIAAGILLLPNNLAAGEQRPLVVCQHGLEGTPWDTITRQPRAHASYKAFSEELVKQGFLVYAPQNPYRGGDRFRVLQRMSNPLARSLFSYIVAQHEQTLDWLATLPQVAPSRIAFYGLSYGGKTAMRVPPLVERYSMAICSGDFTDWPRTIASNEERVSYLFTAEYEIPEWNLAHVASYAEQAMLISPRPLMVEAGHRDGGQPSDWVAGEFGKVRRHYDQLGIGERAELEFFDGPHTIHGQGTFRFLRRFLQPPE